MPDTTVIAPRKVDAEHVVTLAAAGLQPLLARLYAARGVSSPLQLATDLGGLAPLARMHNVERMAGLLASVNYVVLRFCPRFRFRNRTLP